MRLPLKFLPRMSQLIADVVGGAIMLVIGLSFFSDYATPTDLDRYNGFLGWLHANWASLPFMVGSILLLLFGLAWFTIAAINLASNSPFNYLIVDRTGITYRNFWRENRYRWDNLGLIQSQRFSAWQGRSSTRRNWIVADAAGEDKVYGTAPFWSNPTDTLRIPANVYLGGGLLIGSLELSTGDAVRWLEDLRQRARDGGLDGGDIPPPPDTFRPPIEIEEAATTVRTGRAIDRG